MEEPLLHPNAPSANTISGLALPGELTPIGIGRDLLVTTHVQMYSDMKFCFGVRAHRTALPADSIRTLDLYSIRLH